MAEADRAEAKSGSAPIPAWLLEQFPARREWRSLRGCSLHVDDDLGAGLDMEATELGYVVENVAATPGQEPELRRGAAIVAVAGERLLGITAVEVEAVFGRHFADGVGVLLLDADELREAMIVPDSSAECPCDEPEEGESERIVPPEENANYELLRRAKSSTEYASVVHIPVGRATVWELGPEPMSCFLQDLARLSEEFGIVAEPKANRAGSVESITLSGLSTDIAKARPRAVEILNYYRQGNWQASGDVDAQQASNAADAAGGGSQIAQASENVKDLRQFKYHDHTADIIVHSWGATRAEAFAQAVVGMFNYMTDVDNVELRSIVEVEASGHDLLDLLYHLLDEFLFIFGTEMHVSRCVEILEFDEERLRIRARGHGEKMNLKKHEQGTEIKAITMHMMRILGPDAVLTEAGARPRAEAGEDDSQPVPGFPHEVYVLLDI